MLGPAPAAVPMLRTYAPFMISPVPPVKATASQLAGKTKDSSILSASDAKLQ